MTVKSTSAPLKSKCRKRVQDSDDYDLLSMVLKEAEPYEVLVHERDAVAGRRNAIINAAVSELAR